ncbi:MAG TPA: hypothetical protein VNL36_10715 [Bacteroidota bacterium]|nr:hypothetical protein [Bacteroidota bacterium]
MHYLSLGTEGNKVGRGGSASRAARFDDDRFARALINIINYSADYVPPDGVIRLSTAAGYRRRFSIRPLNRS